MIVYQYKMGGGAKQRTEFDKKNLIKNESKFEFE